MNIISSLRKLAGRIHKAKITISNKTAFSNNFDLEKPSHHTMALAKRIGGENRKPAIMLHGVASRCGTNYIAALLNLNSGLELSPNQINEMHFLTPLNHLLSYSNEFFMRYEKNADRIGQHEFLTLFGASILAYLQSFISSDQRILAKVATVKHLSYFPIIFPFENLILVMRDGRDVVFSSMKTWPNSNFNSMCHRWNNGAKLILEFMNYYKNNDNYYLVNYEEVFGDPHGFIKKACQRFSLDLNEFPLDKIQTLPVIGSSLHSRRDGKVTWKPIERPEDFNPFGRWKKWTDKQKRAFKKIAGEQLIRAGYEKDMSW
jgi:protein-tyrosine sulfotransferase